MGEILVDRETTEADLERDRGVPRIRVETIPEEMTPRTSRAALEKIMTSALFAAAR